MEGILVWQIAVAVSVVAARLFSRGAMLAVALCWTIFTFFAVWAQALVVLQLATAWGTVGLLTLVFGRKRVGSDSSGDGHGSASPTPSQVPSPTSSAAPRAGKASVEHLIDELLSTPGMRDDTRVDLNSHLVQLRSGRLHPLDETYVRDLHRRLADPSVGQTGPAAERVGEQGAAAQGVDGLGAFDLFATVQRLAAAADQATGKWDSHVKAQLEKQRANSELFSQLHLLSVNIKHALKSGEEKLHTDKLLVTDPVFAQHYQRQSSQFPPASKSPLEGLSLEPVRADALPKLALEDRLERLTTALRELNDASARLAASKELMEAVDSGRQASFKSFASEQGRLIREHIAKLSSQDRPLEEALRTTSATDMSTHVNEAAAPELFEAKRLDNSKGTASAHPGGSREFEIQAVASARRIRHLVHFTRCENLPTIFRHGLMAVSTSARAGLSVARNDTGRWDGQLDGTSLSIAFPNHSMFFKYRQLSADADWAVLLIAPQVLWEKDCAFYPHNAADGRMVRRPRDELKSAAALSDMFADGEGRPASLRPCDPTDPQAEVMVYEVVEPSLIEAVAFETAAARERHRHLLEGCESFYAGAGKGLFAARHHTITN
jgi:hypothetical protein